MFVKFYKIQFIIYQRKYTKLCRNLRSLQYKIGKNLIKNKNENNIVYEI